MEGRKRQIARGKPQIHHTVYPVRGHTGVSAIRFSLDSVLCLFAFSKLAWYLNPESTAAGINIYFKMKLLFFVHNSGFWCCNSSWIVNQHQNVAHQNGRESKSNIRWSQVLILLSDYISLKIKYLIYARAMEPRGCNHQPAYGNRWGVFILALCSVCWKTVVLKGHLAELCWLIFQRKKIFLRSSSVFFWLLMPSLILSDYSLNHLAQRFLSLCASLSHQRVWCKCIYYVTCSFL